MGNIGKYLLIKPVYTTDSQMQTSEFKYLVKNET